MPKRTKKVKRRSRSKKRPINYLALAISVIVVVGIIGFLYAVPYGQQRETIKEPEKPKIIFKPQPAPQPVAKPATEPTPPSSTCYEQGKTSAQNYRSQQLADENTYYQQQLQKIYSFYSSIGLSGSSAENTEVGKENSRHQKVVSSINNDYYSKLQKAGCS